MRVARDRTGRLMWIDFPIRRPRQRPFLAPSFCVSVMVNANRSGRQVSQYAFTPHTLWHLCAGPREGASRPARGNLMGFFQFLGQLPQKLKKPRFLWRRQARSAEATPPVLDLSARFEEGVNDSVLHLELLLAQVGGAAARPGK